MKAKAKIPVKWDQSELDFLRNNYYSMTWNELTKAIQSLRPEVELPAIRHQCRRMGLAKCIQIRWSKEDIEFLRSNYKTMGNIEIAEILTEKGRSYRMIDGKNVVRKFTKKNIEKKIKLLKLVRTEEDLKFIRQHNFEIGKGYCWTKEENAYTLGLKPVFDEGVIRIWNTNGYDRKYIKINGGFISYARYQYEKYFGAVPKGYNVWHKDGDQLNCDPDNLYIITDADQSLERSIRYYPDELKSLLRLNNQLGRNINKITSKNK